MKNFSKILFNLLQTMIRLFSVLLYILNVIFSISFFIFLFHLDNGNLWKYSGMGMRSHVYLKIELIILMIMIMVLSVIIICHYINKIINNLKLQKYFVEENSLYIRNIMYSLILFIIGNLVLNVYMIFNHLKNVTEIFGLAHTSLMTYIIYFALLSAVYVIYNVFKYGIKLQKDSDSFI